MALAPAALAQTQRDWSGQQPVRYADPDVIALDKRFEKYRINNTTIQRVWTGALWAEGPAWNGAGRYLVWSDLPNNRQMRWLEEDGHVSVFRSPSEYSNGNTFDFEGRQVSCQHGLRRVVRFEPDGATTVIADKWQGKPLNSPNDLVVHPDGAVWFTDPPYGILGNYEGFQAKPEIKEAVYRVEPKTGKMDKVTDELDKPNGICFSPDYKKVYICDTGDPKDIQVFDVVDGKSLRNKRQFTNMTIPGKGSGSGRRDSRRHRRQHLGRRGLGWRGLRRRPRVHAGRRAHRNDRAAGGLRQRLLRRQQAEPPVHGRQPVAVRRVRGDARGACPSYAPRLIGILPPASGRGCSGPCASTPRTHRPARRRCSPAGLSSSAMVLVLPVAASRNWIVLSSR